LAVKIKNRGETMNVNELEKFIHESGIHVPVSKKVLFVDDEAEQLEVVKELLSDSCEILTAGNAKDALDIIEKNEIDVIIADQRMPEMTGVELLERVKTMSPLVVRIILTAYSDTDVIINAINRCEVFRFLLKPWTPEVLEHTIETALSYRFLTKGIFILIKELDDRRKQLEATLKELEESREKILHQERLASMGKFAATISHDLRNELFILLGTVTAMKDMKIDENLREMIEMEYIAIENICNLASGIYEYSRPQKPGLNIESINIKQILEELIKFMKWRSDFKQIKWEVHCENVQEWTLDRQKIKQLLLNLLSNGAEAIGNQKGSIDVYVRIKGDVLQIEVRDSGKGISPEIAEKIWEPFFSTKGSKGLGLGLEICKQIVMLHGGKIYFESVPGKGTKFFVEIPKLK